MLKEGSITAEALARVAGLGLADMEASVTDLHHGLDWFLQSVVRHRNEKVVLGWKDWILEDPSAHPYRWLRPDLVPPSPFCSVILGILLVGLVLLLNPALIDAEFREAWMHYFSRSSRGSADLDDFSVEVGDGWLPVLDVFHLHPLTGDVLVDVVRKKKSTAGGLDGWGWKELEAPPSPLV